MANTSTCPLPFLSDQGFSNEGYVAGRFCGPNPLSPGTSCCLPCPVQQWVYSDSLLNNLRAPGWISVASLAVCGFLLLTWLLVPPEQSHRHYLSVGLIACLLFVQLAFIIPLGTDPDLCYDAITPHDMHTSLSCAVTGALFQAGGLGAAFWIALRTLWLHIRVCWDRIPGKNFLWLSVTSGILVPVAFLIAATLVSGYSFRLGSTCVINHDKSFAVFWGWLLGFAAFAFLMQWITTAYCILVYIRHMRLEHKRNIHLRNTNGNGNGDDSRVATMPTTEPGTIASGKGSSAYANYSRLRVRKLRKMLFMQWRGFAISVLVVVESIFFVTVFWSQDKRFDEISSHPELQPEVQLWSFCLILNQGDKDKCLDIASKFVLSPTTVLACFVMASLVGIEIFLVVARKSMFKGWWEILSGPSQWYHSRRSSLPFTSMDPDINGIASKRTSKLSFNPFRLSRASSSTSPRVANNAGDRRFYSGGWAQLRREPSMRSPSRASSWRLGRNRNSRSGGIATDPIALATITEPNSALTSPPGHLPPGGLRSPPRAGIAARRTLVRDISNRMSGMRIETEDEALRRLRRISGMDLGAAGNRESMVLGEETWPKDGRFSFGDSNEPNHDDDEKAGIFGEGLDNGKGKEKEKRTSRFHEKKGSWVGDEWDDDDKTSRASDGSQVSDISDASPAGESSAATSDAEERKRKSMGKKIVSPLRVTALAKTRQLVGSKSISGGASPRARSIKFADEKLDGGDSPVGSKPKGTPVADLESADSNATGLKDTSGKHAEVLELNQILEDGPAKEAHEDGGTVDEGHSGQP